MTWVDVAVASGFLIGVPIVVGVAYALGIVGRRHHPDASPRDRRTAAGSTVFVVILNALPLVTFAVVAVLIHGIAGVGVGIACAALYLLFGSKRISSWAVKIVWGRSWLKRESQ